MFKRGNSKWGWLLPLLFLLLAWFCRPALAWVRGTAHDFRPPANGGPNAAYAKLGQTAGGDACRACHRLTGAGAQDYPWLADDGWEPQVKVAVPGAGRCLGCHDGEIPTEYGIEEMQNPRRIIAGGKHRRHRTEFPFPPSSPKLQIGASVLNINGKVMAVGPNGVQLPLYVNRRTGEIRAGCLTCHNHHLPGESGLFLRTGTVQELCRTCHQSSR